jgi:hypothetical protein
MACNLEHVPERLHKTEGKQVINAFEVGEEIYRRCTDAELENPFKSISICELSLNRKGLADNHISQPEDVLINITGVGDAIYNKTICTLIIKDVCNETLTYNKEFVEEKQTVQYSARMRLMHEPSPCMYPHCVFRVWLNDQLITLDNYRDTIDKLKQIKTQLKASLASMILQRRISQAN